MNARKTLLEDGIHRGLLHHVSAGTVRTVLRPHRERKWWVIGLYGQETRNMTTSEAFSVCQALAAAEKYSARVKELESA